MAGENILFINVKEEDSFIEICHGCLSSDRSLVVLSENTDLFLNLLGRNDGVDPSYISLCWECSAMLRNTRRFQQRIQRAQDIMRQSLNQEEHRCLSTLAILKIENYSNADIIHSEDRKRESDRKDSNIQRFENLLRKQMYDKFEIKQEDSDSEAELSDDDSGRDLDGKKECVGEVTRSVKDEVYKEIVPNWNPRGVTIKKVNAPINDIYVTVEPLPTKPKSEDDDKATDTELFEPTELQGGLAEGIDTKKEAVKKPIQNTEKLSGKNTKTKDKPDYYPCDLCSFVTSIKEKLTEHKNIHENRLCELCGQSFIGVDDLKTHMLAHQGKFFPCPICGKNYTMKYSLSVHLRTHTGKGLFECKVCKRTFPRRVDVSKHMISHSGIKPYSCNMCDKSYTRVSDLRLHQRSHTGERPHSCEVCFKRFKRPCDVKKHLRTHTGEKPHKCEFCEKRFSCETYFKEHLKIHTKKKTFVCKVCNEKFTDREEYKTHLTTHAEEKPYSCEVCDKGFNSEETLETHLKIHSEDRPHKCETCDKRFSTKGNLQIHVKIHTGDKPYNCEVCGMRFIKSWHLKRHLRTHTGEKPYACTQCDVKFARPHNLKKHIKVHHKVDTKDHHNINSTPVLDK